MPEFCLDCWNKWSDCNLSKKDVAIFKDYDLCECCGEIKHVIIRLKHDVIIKDVSEKELGRGYE